MVRQTVRVVMSLVLVAAAIAAGVSPVEAAEKVKNVIVLVPDGCSSSVFTAARWVKGEPLVIDKYASGMLQTWMANSIITGSAAAATAFATGQKTSVRFLGVGPRPDDVLSNLPVPPEEIQYAPIATVLEGAKIMGKATGLVSTSRITHATPAAYAVHIHDRGMDNEIMEHIVYNGVDVVFGGGHRHLIPTDEGGKRTDGENLETALLDRGYDFITTRDELMSTTSGKVWGMFGWSHMEADMDRAEFAPTEPSLAEMTAKAIEVLSQDSDGFFLMVEASQIDWAGHNNDPIYMITDTLAFDEAFEAAVEFAKADGNTLVIAFPDHNTGAMAIGHNYTQNGYTATPIEDLTAPLAGMKISSYGVARKIYEAIGGGDLTTDAVIAGVDEWWGLELSQAQAQEIIDLIDVVGSLNYAMATVVSRDFTVFGWTTYGHTGEDVPIWSMGPHRMVGGFDNTRIAFRVAFAFGFNLNLINDFLFVDIADYFPDYELDMSDPENPVVKVGDCSLPVSKDYMEISGVTSARIPLPGLTVYAPMTGKCYTSLTAIALMQGITGFSTPEAVSEVESRLEILTDELGIDVDLAALSR